MSSASVNPADVAAPAARRLGHVAGARPGPMLVVVAGIHGNEPAGVRALQRVMPELSKLAPRMAGDVVALAGNLRALAANQRFLHDDLNRRWTAEEVDRVRLRPPGPGAAPEDHERAELLRELDLAIAVARGPLYFLDLHTTSAEGIPFAMVSRQARPADFALHFPLPVIVGMLEQVHGVLLEYMRERGCQCLGVEGGQHDSPASLAHHQAVVWIAAMAAGLVSRDLSPALPGALRLLDEARHGLPHVIEVERRHAITADDRFTMEPGFANIQRVRAGQLLAHDLRGAIHAEHDGLLLLPLYQAQGDDGFFLGRELAL